MAKTPEGDGAALQFNDREALEAWLKTQPREVAVAIAARAALRVLPLVALGFPKVSDEDSYKRFLKLKVGPIFRAISLARAAATYPDQSRMFTVAARRAQVAFPFGFGIATISGDAEIRIPARFVHGVIRAAASAAAAVLLGADAGSVAVSAVVVGDADDDYAFSSGAGNTWEAVSQDAAYVARNGGSSEALTIRARELAHMVPMWAEGVPDWAKQDWRRLQDALPREDDWQVWTDWYERRLKGVADPEAIELVFATVPQSEWDKGPAAANRWIKERLEELESAEGAQQREIASPEVPDLPPPQLPQPGPGPKVAVVDERLDLAPHRAKVKPPLRERSRVLLDELREGVRDFANSFEPGTNAHNQIRKVLDRYRTQIDLDDPDVDLIFALGLRFENAWLAAQRDIAGGLEPTLENSQQEALWSVLRIHAVFIASDPDGVELLAAAERYAYKPNDDEDFKKRATSVATRIGETPNLATERLIELLKGVLAEMGQGEHPNRAGLIGRNTVQRALLTLAQYAVAGVITTAAGQVFIRTAIGQEIIVDSALFADKAIAFFLNNVDALRVLAMAASEGFGFLVPLIEWLKAKLGI